MKKKNLKTLTLNKSKISNLVKIQGGVFTYFTTISVNLATCAPGGTTSENNCGGVTDNTVVPTCDDGCTRATVELSYCNNGVPQDCQSVDVCA